MSELLYVTSNKVKVRTANEVCNQFDIALVQHPLDIPEIQGEDGEIIARDKAAKAFEAVKQPIIVSDDSWFIPALGGFPGAYMKSVNAWFAPQDWLDLMHSKDDRAIILRQYVVYQDRTVQKIFYADITGEILREIRGNGSHTHDSVTSFDGGKTSIAEADKGDRSAITSSNDQTSWHQFAEWYTNYHERQQLTKHPADR
jgi:XTP/dITP diphosphohydrolase